MSVTRTRKRMGERAGGFGPLRLEPTELRGFHVVELIDPRDGWPLSNLRRGGCKHDVTHRAADGLHEGRSARCGKCGTLLVPISWWRTDEHGNLQRWHGWWN